jgi:hypothetical protein
MIYRAAQKLELSTALNNLKWLIGPKDAFARPEYYFAYTETGHVKLVGCEVFIFDLENNLCSATIMGEVAEDLYETVSKSLDPWGFLNSLSFLRPETLAGSIKRQKSEAPSWLPLWMSEDS